MLAENKKQCVVFRRSIYQLHTFLGIQHTHFHLTSNGYRYSGQTMCVAPK